MSLRSVLASIPPMMMAMMTCGCPARLPLTADHSTHPLVVRVSDEKEFREALLVIGQGCGWIEWKSINRNRMTFFDHACADELLELTSNDTGQPPLSASLDAPMCCCGINCGILGSHPAPDMSNCEFACRTVLERFGEGMKSIIDGFRTRSSTDGGTKPRVQQPTND